MLMPAVQLIEDADVCSSNNRTCAKDPRLSSALNESASSSIMLEDGERLTGPPVTFAPELLR
jgi:hypothetical protein